MRLFSYVCARGEGGRALDQKGDGGVRTDNGKTHPSIHFFSEIRPISTDFYIFLQLLDDYWERQLKVETFEILDHFVTRYGYF